MRRRDFIRNLGFGAAAIASTGVGGCAKQDPPPPQEQSETKETAIQVYNEIGTTGLKMSDISMGCGGLDSPYTVERAIDVGINYFDTAPDYQNGQSEMTLGKVFKDPAKREKCIITTKFCARGSYGLHLDYGTPESEFISAVEGSLERLNTDYIDFVQVHAIGERENDRPRLTDAPMLSAVAKLKEQGKIKFLGVTSHGPHCMEDCLIDAIDSGHFAMLMPAFNFMRHKRLGEVLQKAQEKGVGIVAMKTMAGAKEEDLYRYRQGETDLASAAFKWVFTQPGVNGLVITMRTGADVDKFAAASGKRFTEEDRALLDRYGDEVSRQYCRTGCGDCLASCPHGVAVANILRYDMYFTAYRDQHNALRAFSNLPEAEKPLACAQCSGPCVDNCTYGLPVQERLLAAAERLQMV